MKSFPSVLFYLTVDTLHRWVMRVSNPLARFLVVFCLVFCALTVLSHYLLSARTLEGQIRKNGGDMIVMARYCPSSEVAALDPLEGMPRYAGGRECVILNELFQNATIRDRRFKLVEYPLWGAGLFQGMDVRPDNGVFVLPPRSEPGASPEEVMVTNHRIRAVVVPEYAAMALRKIYPNGGVFVPEGVLSALKMRTGLTRMYMFRFEQTEVASMRVLEKRLLKLIELDGWSAQVRSSLELLEELETTRASQQVYRMGISLGIGVIVCVLLTSISSMEFRQNEYIYALMNSFGVNRLLLVAVFMVENCVLVFGALACAVTLFHGLSGFLVKEFLKMPGMTLSVVDMRDDIVLLSVSLLTCIAVSTIPIVCAVFRPVGCVLK